MPTSAQALAAPRASVAAGFEGGELEGAAAFCFAFDPAVAGDGFGARAGASFVRVLERGAVAGAACGLVEAGRTFWPAAL